MPPVFPQSCGQALRNVSYSRPIGQAINFAAVVSSFFSLSSFYFPGLFSAVADWMSTILPHLMCLVRIWNAGLKCAARGSVKMQDAKITQKLIAIGAPSHKFVGLCLRI